MGYVLNHKATRAAASPWENNWGQMPVNSQPLLIQELLAPVFIGLEAKMIDKNRQKSPFKAVERRKPPLQACKKPKTGHSYPSKVSVSQ
jgi:hypothetical protein